MLAFSLIILVLLVACAFANAGYQERRRRKPWEEYLTWFTPDSATSGPLDSPTTDASSQARNGTRLSIADMTCGFFQQALNHFDLPRGQSGTYQQRYCVYNDFMVNETSAPIFLYTGNESPLEQYINHTGLIWESAEAFGAQVVFVEHRYEGQSLPSPFISSCMAYSSTIQALADFARFVELKLFVDTGDFSRLRRRPVIAFGGSYGGMLSAWLRMKYPNTIAGAIAGSAPIWGFPRNFPSKIDAAYRVIQHGLQQSYPPTLKPLDNNHCATNLLATWPLISALAQHHEGLQLLTSSFRLCEVLKDGDTLIDWAQSPWFDLAEGSFPYSSSYIPFALTHKDAKLPAWPLQAACWTDSDLHLDWGVKFLGNRSDIRYAIEYGDSGISLTVDWENVVADWANIDNISKHPIVVGLLESVRDSISVWFNVTKDVECYDLLAAPNSLKQSVVQGRDNFTTSRFRIAQRNGVSEKRRLNEAPSSQCEEKMKTGSWNSLCCNEEMNLIITEALGLGNDPFWPPSHPRGTRTYADVIRWRGNATDNNEFCADPNGIFGYPLDATDPWSTWYDTIYGGTEISSHSNIIFSNGLLDPWSAAGVYAPGLDPTVSHAYQNHGPTTVPGLYTQNISQGSDSMIALLIEYGGHHTDLMYASPADPPCVTEARVVERRYIQRWIDEFWTVTN